MKPLVSILVPLYNHSAYVEECLNSFLDIDYPNVEVLICNDGSKDNSLEIVERWCLEHPTLNVKLFNQTNQGVCKTLNSLVQASNGKYIVLCASDDALLQSSLASRVQLLESNSLKLACIGDAYLIDSNSNIVSKSAMKALYRANFEQLENDIVNELIISWSVVGPTLLIAREAYFKVGLYDEHLLVEDRDFYLRLLANDMLLFVPDAVAKYRVHNSNASRKSKASRLVIYKEIAKANIKNADSFAGVNKLYLISHKLDLIICNLKSDSVSFILIKFLKGVRLLIFKLLKFIRRT